MRSFAFIHGAISRVAYGETLEGFGLVLALSRCFPDTRELIASPLWRLVKGDLW